MPAKPRNTAADSTATIGFKATARRESATPQLVALPGQLFNNTQIPVGLWFYEKNNTLDSANDTRLFDGETNLSLVA